MLGKFLIGSRVIATGKSYTSELSFCIVMCDSFLALNFFYYKLLSRNSVSSNGLCTRVVLGRL